uniref:Uncharacterized protein n=1 Tax=Cacopsylla melanoneura TaxID=428564 RepID=A0A8D9F4B1_9HEMI
MRVSSVFSNHCQFYFILVLKIFSMNRNSGGDLSTVWINRKIEMIFVIGGVIRIWTDLGDIWNFRSRIAVTICSILYSIFDIVIHLEVKISGSSGVQISCTNSCNGSASWLVLFHGYCTFCCRRF